MSKIVSNVEPGKLMHERILSKESCLETSKCTSSNFLLLTATKIPTIFDLIAFQRKAAMRKNFRNPLRIRNHLAAAAKSKFVLPTTTTLTTSTTSTTTSTTPTKTTTTRSSSTRPSKSEPRQLFTDNSDAICGAEIDAKLRHNLNKTR